MDLAKKINDINHSRFSPAFVLPFLGRAEEIPALMATPSSLRAWADALKASMKVGPVGSLHQSRFLLERAEASLVSYVKEMTRKDREKTLGPILMSLAESPIAQPFPPGRVRPSDWFGPERLATRRAQRKARAAPKR
ncbi:MAG: hypothetical protein ACHQ50_17130 [Fimbriimonadales bacterium]